jgi:hypothetical protein
MLVSVRLRPYLARHEQSLGGVSQGGPLAHLSHHGGIRGLVRDAFARGPGGDDFRLGPDAAWQSLLPRGGDAGQELARQNLRSSPAVGLASRRPRTRGAALEKGKSVGLNIELPRNKKAILRQRAHQLPPFFLAQSLAVKYSVAFIFMPGGFGTLDEFSEIATLIQTERIPKFPLIFSAGIFGPASCAGCRRKGNKYIGPEDLDLFTITDDPQEAISIIREYLHRVGPPERVPMAFS